MKRRTSILIGTFILTVATLLESCATKPYITKEDEEIFGTWVNTSYSYTIAGSDDYAQTLANYAQKIITQNDGTYEVYMGVGDIVPQFKFQYTITDKWTDSDGSIWYKIVSKYKSEYTERTRFGLNKINNTGRTWEYVVSVDDYPTQIDPSHPTYRKYYRQEEKGLCWYGSLFIYWICPIRSKSILEGGRIPSKKCTVVLHR